MKYVLFPIVALCIVARAFAQGPLAPPGAPGPTFKTLQQVEPRTPISTLPYTIAAPGSYYLTTNLTGAAGTNGITIMANAVTLDLMGFELAGVAGSLVGIYVPDGVSVTNLSIHGGTVRGWGTGGVNAFGAINTRISEMRASNNGFIGLAGDGNSIISGCSAELNGTGISGGVIRDCNAVENSATGINGLGTVIGCTAVGSGLNGIYGRNVVDCVASFNGRSGIFMDDNSRASSCQAEFNTGNGITGGRGALVEDCTVSSNGGTGIVVGTHSSVMNCVLRDNGRMGIVAAVGSTVRGNTVRISGDDGIRVPNDCMVSDNHCTDNGKAGIHATSAGNRIEGNSTILNQQGLLIDAGANLIIRNSSRFNPDTGSIGSSNYVIVAGNTVGPLVNSINIATNFNPHANYEP